MTIITVLLIGIGVRFTMMGSQSKEMKPELGVKNERLTKCSSKPNCVTSFYPEDKDHYHPAIQTSDSFEVIKSKIIESELNWKLIKEEDNYLYFTFESSLMGFVDDVEVYLVGDQLHFRSASRVGYSDLGANKKRMLKLEAILK